MQNTIYHGLKPGIYMQTEPDKCRGALGSEEQALLICDVQPQVSISVLCERKGCLRTDSGSQRKQESLFESIEEEI